MKWTRAIRKAWKQSLPPPQTPVMTTEQGDYWYRVDQSQDMATYTRDIANVRAQMQAGTHAQRLRMERMEGEMYTQRTSLYPYLDSSIAQSITAQSITFSPSVGTIVYYTSNGSSMTYGSSVYGAPFTPLDPELTLPEGI